MPKVDVQLMSPAAYARHRGVSRQAVANAIRRGRITPTADGRINPITADAEWQANSRPYVQSKPTAQVEAAPPNAGHVSLHEAKRRAEVARAEMLERENRKQAGELLPADAIVERWQAILWSLRQKFLALPSRLAAETPGTNEHRAEVHAIAERLIHEALTEAADERCTP